MNAAVRAAFRMRADLGLEGVAIHNGYQGLLGGQVSAASDVPLDGIERLGGTVLCILRGAGSPAPKPASERSLRQFDTPYRGVAGGHRR